MNRSCQQYSVIIIIIYITRQGVLIAILVKVCVFCFFFFALWFVKEIDNLLTHDMFVISFELVNNSHCWYLIMHFGSLNYKPVTVWGLRILGSPIILHPDFFLMQYWGNCGVNTIAVIEWDWVGCEELCRSRGLFTLVITASIWFNNYCLHLPNLVTAGWFWRISQGILAN